MSIPKEQWQWFGHAAHFICGSDCRFHLATLIGDYVISTVGEYLPDSQVREILARSRGVSLEGRGDDRRADWMRKVGYEEIGLGRKFETMVFKWNGDVCDSDACHCGLPNIDPTELDFDSYNDAAAARLGHMALCEKWAAQ